jgi:hypothetical protein
MVDETHHQDMTNASMIDSRRQAAYLRHHDQEDPVSKH